MSNIVLETGKKHTKMKQDVYEHLAKTFLEKKKKNLIRNNKLLVFAGFGILILVLLFFIFTINSLAINKKIYSKQLWVAQDRMPVVINYDFTTPGISKIITASLNLDRLDIRSFNFINFSIRTGNGSKINSSVKVALENSRKEKGSKYITEINRNWEKINISLKEFASLSDKSSIDFLTFIVEEWNVTNKKDKIYIDDIKFSQ